MIPLPVAISTMSPIGIRVINQLSYLGGTSFPEGHSATRGSAMLRMPALFFASWRLGSLLCLHLGLGHPDCSACQTQMLHDAAKFTYMTGS